MLDIVSPGAYRGVATAAKKCDKNPCKTQPGPPILPPMDIFNENEQAVEVEILEGEPLAPLTLQHENFCAAYLETGVIDRAERLAGLSEGYGTELLRKPHIKAEVARLKARALVKHEVTMDHIISKLAAIVDLDPAEAYDLALEVQSVTIKEGKDGIQIEEVRAALLSIPVEIRKLMQIDFTAKGIQIKFLDKLKAYDMLTKIKGGYAPEKIDLNTPLIQNINIIRQGSE